MRDFWNNTTWPVVRLNEIASFSSGGTPSRKRSEFFGGGIPWLTGQDIPEDCVADVSTGREFVTADGIKESATTIVPEGTVLVTTRVTVGKTAVASRPLCFSQDVTGVQIGSPAVASPHFLAYFLHSLRQKFLQRNQGSTIAGITRDNLTLERIPLPALSEQERIVSILRDAEIARLNHVSAERRTIELLPAFFTSLFGELSENSKGWPIVPLSEFVTEFEGGKSLPDEGSDVPGRPRVLKISAVTSGRFDPTESKSVPSGYEPPAHHFVKRGDLLISRANTEELVAATAYVEECPPNILLSDKLWRFVWRNPDQVSPLFMSAFFRDPYIRYKMSRLATGTGGSMKNISKKKLMSMRVPLPPYEVQQKFEAVCAEVRAIQRMMAESEAAQELSASLLARAFTGELTAEWRERNADKLDQEARDRDAALAASGVKLSRAPKAPDIEAIFQRRTDGAYAELTREQHTVLEAAEKAVGGVKTPRWFTSEHVAKQLGGPWRKNLHAIEAALGVLSARGLIIAVSREDAQPITGEIYYGTAYRLPKDNYE
jgi:type I restriction enzyme S subunit